MTSQSQPHHIFIEPKMFFKSHLQTHKIVYDRGQKMQSYVSTVMKVMPLRASLRWPKKSSFYLLKFDEIEDDAALPPRAICVTEAEGNVALRLFGDCRQHHLHPT